MIRMKFVHRVCGHCIVHDFCKGIDCLDCPVQKLIDYIRWRKEHPIPQLPEDNDESPHT